MNEPTLVDGKYYGIDPDSGYIGIRVGLSTCTMKLDAPDIAMTDDELIDRFVRPMLCAVRRREADRKEG